MADIAIFRINYKSDFILTLNSDAGWMTPFCIKFWTGAPSQAYFVGYDGTTYTHCAPVEGEPTKLVVQFDDHHLPIGDLKFQIGYHFTVADFPTTVEDEVINQAAVIIDQDGTPAQVMLDLNGETAPEIQFSLPAYANEAQRIANEEQRIAAEAIRIANEESRITAETIRQQNEEQRIAHETARVNEFATLKSQSQAATSAANTAAALANQKAQLAADKAALADAAATLANQKAQLAADKAALADAAATLANQKAQLAADKAALAQQKADYAQTQGDYAKAQGDYAKEQGDTALADHERAEADHATAAADHTTAQADHTQAATDHATASADHTTAQADHNQAATDHTTAQADHTQAATDHTTAASDHTTAGNDHTRAESDHTRAESDHAAVEVFIDSLGVFDLSKYNAVGGVLATYADLDAALTALNALDSQYKYGGMSFKFVQSSDNKYVQYIYKGTAVTGTPNPFLDTNNWEKVVLEKELEMEIGHLSNMETMTAGSSSNYYNYVYGDFKSGQKIFVKWDGDAVASNVILRNHANTDIIYHMAKGIWYGRTLNADTSELHLVVTGANISTSGDATLYISIGVASEIEDIKEKCGAKESIQVYASTGINYEIEENYGINNSIYIHNRSWCVRVPFDLTYVNNSALAAASDITLVTSPSGATNCIEIPNTYCFVIDLTTKKFAIKSRSVISINDCVLVSCVDGRIVGLGYGFEDSVILQRIYDTNDKIYKSVKKTETIAQGATSGKHIYFVGSFKKDEIIKIIINQGITPWIDKFRIYDAQSTLLANPNADSVVYFTLNVDTESLDIQLYIDGLKKDGNNEVIGGTVSFELITGLTVEINKNIDDINILNSNLSSLNPTLALKNKLQFYNPEGAYPIIKKVGTSLYFKGSGIGAWAGRCGVNLNYNNNQQLASAMGVPLVNISETDAGYIELGITDSFVFDTVASKPAIKSRTDVINTDIVLLSNAGGYIVGINSDTFGYPYISNLIEELGNRVTALEGELPSVVTENTDVLIPQIRSHQTSKSATFCFLTDLHNLSYNETYSKDNNIIKVIRHIIQGINVINEGINIWTTIFGGDYLWNSSSSLKNVQIDCLRDLSDAIRGIKDMPKLVIKGNHDDNSMGTLANMLDPETYYKTFPLTFESNEVVIDVANPSGNYGYFDIKPQKIRIIYLNSVDIPWIEEGGSVRYKGQYTCGVQQAQLNFVADALRFEEDGWSVMFVSHHCITPITDFADGASEYVPATNGGSQLLGIIEAFKNKTSFNGTITGDFASVVNVDYTNNASNGIICLLNGHTHADRNAVKDGMLFLATTTATQSNTYQNTDGSTYAPTPNSKNEGAADFITIDKLNGIIYLDRYGFGVSRKFYYTGEDIGEIPE